jgi:hypothetical protein
MKFKLKIKFNHEKHESHEKITTECTERHGNFFRRDLWDGGDFLTADFTDLRGFLVWPQRAQRLQRFFTTDFLTRIYTD